MAEAEAAAAAATSVKYQCHSAVNERPRSRSRSTSMSLFMFMCPAVHTYTMPSCGATPQTVGGMRKRLDRRAAGLSLVAPQMDSWLAKTVSGYP